MKQLRFRVAVISMFAATVWAGACSTESPEGESESHFLGHCDGSCEDGLDCVCGVCTKICEGSGECEGIFEGAACVARPDCAGTRACDVPCGAREDCRVLSEAAMCAGGYCRLAPDPSIADASTDGPASADPCCLDGTLEVTTVRSVGTPFDGPAHTFSPCRAHEWSNGSQQCSDEVPACDVTGIDVSDLIDALGDPEVAGAFAAAPISYGSSFEGEGTRLTWNGASIFVGIGQCGGGAGCTEIPYGIAALQDVVRQLEQQGAVCSTNAGADAAVSSGTPDSGTPTDAASSHADYLDWDGSRADCAFPGDIEWYVTGDPAGDRHTLTHVYPRYRRERADGVACVGDTPDCNFVGITPRDIADALAPDTVRDAFAAAPTVFGNSASDEGEHVIVIDGNAVRIGPPCAGGEDCVDAPGEILALRDLLHALELQFLGNGTCRPDVDCYLSVDRDSCSGTATRFFYDPASGQCEELACNGDGGNDNRFDSRAACEETCDFDPCLLGSPIATDASSCAGDAFEAFGRCFAEHAAACACECARTSSSACGTCEG